MSRSTFVKTCGRVSRSGGRATTALLLTLVLLGVTSCGEDGKVTADPGESRQGTLEGPVGETVLPTTGVDGIAGTNQAWSASAQGREYQVDAKGAASIDPLGSPDAMNGFVTAMEPANEASAANFMGGLVAMDNATWEAVVQDPTKEFTLFETDVDLGPAGAGTRALVGSLQTGFDYRVAAPDFNWGMSVCLSCDGTEGTWGPVVENRAGVLAVVMLPPGAKDVAADVPISVLEDELSKGVLVMVQLGSKEDRQWIKYTSLSGKSEKMEVIGDDNL